MEDAKAFILSACENGGQVTVERHKATDKFFEDLFSAQGFTFSSDERLLYGSRSTQGFADKLEPIVLESCTEINYIESGKAPLYPLAREFTYESKFVATGFDAEHSSFTENHVSSSLVADIEQGCKSSFECVDPTFCTTSNEQIQCPPTEPFCSGSSVCTTEPIVYHARPLSHDFQETETIFSCVPEDDKLREVSYNLKTVTDGMTEAANPPSPSEVSLFQKSIFALLVFFRKLLTCCFWVEAGPDLNDTEKPLLLDVRSLTETGKNSGSKSNIENHVQKHFASVTTPEFGAGRRGGMAEDSWIDFMRLSGNAPSEITELSKGYEGKLPQQQLPFCSFCFVSSYKRDIGGGFLVRIIIDKLQCGVQNCCQESTKRGYFMERFIISMEPQGSSCAGIVRFTPQPENIKWRVQNNETRSIDIGFSMSSATIGLRGSVNTHSSDDNQLWSWRAVSLGQDPCVCQFSWNMEWWKTPRLKYDVEKPETCGFPIPELPHNGDSFWLPSGITSVEWHVPPDKVSSGLKLSWTFSMKATLTFVEIKTKRMEVLPNLYLTLTHSYSDKQEVVIPFTDILYLELP